MVGRPQVEPNRPHSRRSFYTDQGSYPGFADQCFLSVVSAALFDLCFQQGEYFRAHRLSFLGVFCLQQHPPLGPCTKLTLAYQASSACAQAVHCMSVAFLWYLDTNLEAARKFMHADTVAPTWCSKLRTMLALVWACRRQRLVLRSSFVYMYIFGFGSCYGLCVLLRHCKSVSQI